MELNWQLRGKAQVGCFQLNLIQSINIYSVPTGDSERHSAGTGTGTRAL